MIKKNMLGQKTNSLPTPVLVTAAAGADGLPATSTRAAHSLEQSERNCVSLKLPSEQGFICFEN